MFKEITCKGVPIVHVKNDACGLDIINRGFIFKISKKVFFTIVSIRFCLHNLAKFIANTIASVANCP